MECDILHFIDRAFRPRHVILLCCILQCIAEDCLERKFNVLPTIKSYIYFAKQVALVFVSFHFSAVWKKHIGTFIDISLHNNSCD